MQKTTQILIIITAFLFNTNLIAEIEYKTQDLGTLQTHSSQAIALNNRGQILGCYNADGVNPTKHFFIRTREGNFNEIPNSDAGIPIDWRYLIDDGTVYGEFRGGGYTTFFSWNGKELVNHGNLPGKEIAAINNAGQVLIKSVSENAPGKSSSGPVIWQKGKITKLKAIEGDNGIESIESLGLAMNNKGEVAGRSVISLCYKNKLYNQPHAIKWSANIPVDLHHLIPKSISSQASAINDCGDVYVSIDDQEGYLIGQSRETVYFPNHCTKMNSNYLNNESLVYDKKAQLVTSCDLLDKQLQKDKTSIWMKISKIIQINENGEIIALGKTIYGEEHAIFLTPIKLKAQPSPIPKNKNKNKPKSKAKKI